MLPSQDAEDAYFQSNPPPPALEKHTAAAEAFIQAHAESGRRIVLITSGGTTVPLEKQTVRFIDNFSAGTRGAASAEYFLDAGYAVIFLHRQFSLQPYSRHYSHATDCFLDFLREGPNGTVVAQEEVYGQKLLHVLRQYNDIRREHRLLMLSFVTITDYIWELRAIARLMRPLGPNGLLYLAAAVSDFFVPLDRMSEHKIQSTNMADILPPSPKKQPSSSSSGQNDTEAREAGSNDKKREERGDEADGEEEEEVFDNFDSLPKVPRSKRLIIDLDPVPKFLKTLVDGWAPEGMIVSFKLETDPRILIHKARYSLERYQHHLVIGNLLSTRKWEVVFVSPGDQIQWVRLARPIPSRTTGSGERKEEGEEERETVSGKTEHSSESLTIDRPIDPASLPDGDPEMEIESLIIPEVKKLHDQHIREATKPSI